MISASMLEKAYAGLKNIVRCTPITYDAQRQLYLKWENHQITGSFKLRGALNKVRTLSKSELERGLVPASAGNHGQGVALAARDAKAEVTVFASEHAVPAKLQAMQALGTRIQLVTGGYAEAESAAIQYARAHGAVWISPYNDIEVICGQASIGMELLEQITETPAACLVPAGGGGLIAGIAAAFNHSRMKIPVIGVQSKASSYLHALYHHGDQNSVVETESLADGLSGAVEANSITIELSRRWVNDIILVSEEEIKSAIAFAWLTYHEIIEGSAAVSLAAVLSGKIKHRPLIVVITGGNIQPEIHHAIRSGWNSTGLEERR